MPLPEKNRQRILFVAEAVTLAHVGRPVTLALGLDPQRYDVTFACDSRYDRLLPHLPGRRLHIRSIPGEQFRAALARGAPVYDVDTLRAYAREDLALIADTDPDIIVGDFRLSLLVSAAHTGKPYATLTNAYWSPYRQQRFPVPELPLTRIVGTRIAQCAFNLVRPLAFAHHTRALNRLRREYGQTPLATDLRQTYTAADYTLYCDVPELMATQHAPPNHVYLGPVLWSPALPPPAWGEHLAGDTPGIYVTLGSSGNRTLLPNLVAALSERPEKIWLATAGNPAPAHLPPNIFAADFLPGEEAARRSSLVVCNGGSPTSQQALAHGVPVLGIVGNLDQHLNMAAIQQTGAGITLRSEKATTANIRACVQRLISDDSYTQAARHMAGIFASYSAPARFNALLDKIFAY